MSLFLGLYLALLTEASQKWAAKIVCAPEVKACVEAPIVSAIFLTVEEATAEADRISREGCWIDRIKLNCTSVRSVESFEKLAPGGIHSLHLVQVP